MHSEEVQEVSEAHAGDIIALAGLECKSGTTLMTKSGKAKDKIYSCTTMYVPDPVLSLGVKVQKTTEVETLRK